MTTSSLPAPAIWAAIAVAALFILAGIVVSVREIATLWPKIIGFLSRLRFRSPVILGDAARWTGERPQSLEVYPDRTSMIRSRGGLENELRELSVGQIRVAFESGAHFIAMDKTHARKISHMILVHPESELARQLASVSTDRGELFLRNIRGASRLAAEHGISVRWSRAPIMNCVIADHAGWARLQSYLSISPASKWPNLVAKRSDGTELLGTLCAAYDALWASSAPPRDIEILHEIGTPYRQEWHDDGGCQTLFRVAVVNYSDSIHLEGVSARLTKISPAIHGVPFGLRIMNRPETVHEFSLRPGATEYIDVVQQSRPSGLMYLWHTVPHLPKDIPTQSYDFEITVFANQVSPFYHRRGSIAMDNGVCVFRLL